MAEVVLDTSAILADIAGEPGGTIVRAAAVGAVASAVNVAEVVAKLIAFGMDEREAKFLAGRGDYEVLSVDQSQAIFVGRLHSRHRQHGISLGDSFCLALAQQTGRPVLTADRKWKELEKALGIEVSLIR